MRALWKSMVKGTGPAGRPDGRRGIDAERMWERVGNQRRQGFSSRFLPGGENRNREEVMVGSETQGLGGGDQ